MGLLTLKARVLLRRPFLENPENDKHRGGLPCSLHVDLYVVVPLLEPGGKKCHLGLGITFICSARKTQPKMSVRCRTPKLRTARSTEPISACLNWHLNVPGIGLFLQRSARSCANLGS